MSESTKELSGRELDAAVAEKLMGHNLIPRSVAEARDGLITLASGGDIDDGGVLELSSPLFENDQCFITQYPDNPLHARIYQIPEFSESIEAAMRVVEAVIPLLPDNEVIKNLGFAQVRMYRYANGTWCIAFTKRVGKSVTASTLPEAICRAALAAIGSKE